MLKRNKELRAMAREVLAGKWGTAAVIALVYMAVYGATGAIIFTAILIGLPLGWGFNVLFLRYLRGEEMEVGEIFNGFSDYKRIMGTMLLAGVYTFLWALLLFIPGIIKLYSYSMTAYILYDEPDLKFNAAIEKSMAMMKGHKMKLFLLDLSFIGWAYLCLLFTLGIGMLWLIPYIQTSRAAFYEDLKENRLTSEAAH